MFLDLTDRSVDVSAGASDMTRLPIVFPGRQPAAAAVRSRALILTLGIAFGVSGCSAPRNSAHKGWLLDRNTKRLLASRERPSARDDDSGTARPVA